MQGSAVLNHEPVAQLRERLLGDLKAGRVALPSLPEVALRVREVLHEERRNLARLAKLIQMDAALTARLIQLANSPRHRGRTAVDTCQAAIVRLGLPATVTLATSLTLRNLFHCDHPVLHRHLQGAWQQGCRVAAISYVLTSVTPGFKAERAMLAGQVYNIGTLPLLRYMAQMDQPWDEALISSVLTRLRGPLGSLLLRHWGFDEELVAIPQQGDDWYADSGEALDYRAVVLVARAHERCGRSGEAERPVLIQMPAFRRLPLSRLGPDASIQLIAEAEEEIGGLVRLLQG